MTDPNRNSEKNINRFTDMFHEYGAEMDEDQNEIIIIDVIQPNTKDNDPANPLIDLTSEEQRLSQKLSQLSVEMAAYEWNQQQQVPPTEERMASGPTRTEQFTATTTTTKKMRTSAIDEESDAPLPSFLSPIHDIFQATIQPLLNKAAVTSTIHIEQLRNIARIKYHIAVNDLNKSLWTTYLESGTGNLKTTTTTAAAAAGRSSVIYHLKLWPSDVKNNMIKSGETTAKNIEDMNDDDDACLNYVYKKLRQYRDRNTELYHQLKECKQHLNYSFPLEMEETIDKFVEQHGTTFHRIPIEGQIALVAYKHRDRLIELEFYQQNPQEHQIEIFHNLSRGKFEKEAAKLEVTILKRRLLHNRLPSSFDSLHIPQPKNLSTIQNEKMRQSIIERYEKIVQQTKSDMMRVYIATEEAKLEEIRQRVERESTELRESERRAPLHQKLTPIMLTLLQQRFKNINQHVLDVYTLKMRFFVKAPSK